MSCITLLSDLGVRDASVAVAHGVLMQYASSAQIVDISHHVAPFYTPQAAYLLHASWQNFAPGTVHILLFDLYATDTTRVVLSEYEGHYFIGADNGLLPAALGMQPVNSWLCHELAGDDSYVAWLHAAGNALTLAQTNGISSSGFPSYTLRQSPVNRPRVEGRVAMCDVIHIDRYENVVTNMPRPLFDELRGSGTFTLQFMLVEEISELSARYNDVREGYKLCRFNSAGYLEICVNRGNAAGLYGLQTGSRHNDIKIFFE